MLLALDIGDTSIKCGAFSNGKLQETHYASSPEKVFNWASAFSPHHVIVSSVNARFSDGIKTHYPNSRFLDNSVPLPFVNRYQTPESLGSDRLSAIAGAFSLFPNETCLVIDAGTALTYDIITAEGIYLGGAISPGLTMRFQSLYEQTNKLPLVKKSVGYPKLVGDDTISAIQSGVVNGIISEINGIIEQYRQTYKELRVIITGGDAKYFESNLKASIFVSPDLVLLGLERIYRDYVEKK